MAIALVAAAGAGERLREELPKALVGLAGRPLAAWCLEALAGSSAVERAVIAAPAGFEPELAEVAREAAPDLAVAVVPGGSSRSRSVASSLAAGLAPVAEADESAVVVLDAARPLVTSELIDRCLESLERWHCDGAIAAARATDTIKEADAGGRVLATLERSTLWAVQTPQAFRAGVLRKALAHADLDRAYDDAQLVEAVGGDVRIVEAPRDNIKVTTAFDLEVAEALIEGRS
jgi:2-C-methyl-D-erythritol 4-phosphate cytidylyltransferase